MDVLTSGLKSHSGKQHADLIVFLLKLAFNPEDGSGTFIQNISEHCDYALHPA
jgi:hypothetical protein